MLSLQRLNQRRRPQVFWSVSLSWCFSGKAKLTEPFLTALFSVKNVRRLLQSIFLFINKAELIPANTHQIVAIQALASLKPYIIYESTIRTFIVSDVVVNGPLKVSIRYSFNGSVLPTDRDFINTKVVVSPSPDQRLGLAELKCIRNDVIDRSEERRVGKE